MLCPSPVPLSGRLTGIYLESHKETTMSNLSLWNAFKTVPKEAQKEIKGGRLSGMTDISPMWRYLELTKAFGPCGIGWKYTIDRLWIENGAAPNVCAFAQITLYIKRDGEWSDGIPGIGGSMLVAVEKSGPHTSDEAYKMAVTDAVSVACKVLGMGADIYWFAGSKYSVESEQKPAQKPSGDFAARNRQAAEYTRILTAINTADNIDSLHMAADEINSADIPQTGKDKLADTYQHRVAAFAEEVFK